LKLLNLNFDKILCNILFALRKPVAGFDYKQKLIYKFILSLVPFLFEKVKNVEGSYLMMSESEIDLMFKSEMANISKSVRDPSKYNPLVKHITH